jgi:hypothetical protein
MLLKKHDCRHLINYKSSTVIKKSIQKNKQSSLILEEISLIQL